MNAPLMYRIRQQFAAERLADAGTSLRHELARSTVTIKPRARIAIAVGSRGIANLPLIVGEVVAWVKAQGGEPFIVPAMGSHGGATADGQRRILEKFGVNAAPIVSSMDVVMLEGERLREPSIIEATRRDARPPVYMDRHAWESDGVIAVNRIKPHTSFHGMYESGLMKMLAVGLGKHEGATAIHRQGVAGLRERIPVVARQVLATGKILLGIAIVENAYDETLIVRAIPAQRIPDEEPALLELARRNMPSLPVNEIDLLIVDEMGKDISGTGMDTNIIGRLRIAGEAEPTRPQIKKIFVRDLRGDSAYGIGLADVTTRRLVEEADWNATAVNAQTSGFLLRAQLPEVLEKDDEVIRMAGARVVRIKNTLHLETLMVSEEIRHEISRRDNIEVLGPAKLWDEL